MPVYILHAPELAPPRCKVGFTNHSYSHRQNRARKANPGVRVELFACFPKGTRDIEEKTINFVHFLCGGWAPDMSGEWFIASPIAVAKLVEMFMAKEEFETDMRRWRDTHE